MYLDILGNEVVEGDIVIKSSSNCSSSLVLIGILKGKCLYCLEVNYNRWGEGVTYVELKKVTRVENIYKVCSPSQKDLIVKAKILEMLATGEKHSRL